MEVSLILVCQKCVGNTTLQHCGHKINLIYNLANGTFYTKMHIQK